jgi:hypothetical protein
MRTSVKWRKILALAAILIIGPVFILLYLLADVYETMKLAASRMKRAVDSHTNRHKVTCLCLGVFMVVIGIGGIGVPTLINSLQLVTNTRIQWATLQPGFTPPVAIALELRAGNIVFAVFLVLLAIGVGLFVNWYSFY